MITYMFQNYPENYAFQIFDFLKKLSYFLAVFFLFVNKTLRLNNIIASTAVNAKISVFVVVLKQSYICYYIICVYL